MYVIIEDDPGEYDDDDGMCIYDLEGYLLDTFLCVMGIDAERVVLAVDEHEFQKGAAFHAVKWTECISSNMSSGLTGMANYIETHRADPLADDLWRSRPRWKQALEFMHWRRSLLAPPRSPNLLRMLVHGRATSAAIEEYEQLSQIEMPVEAALEIGRTLLTRGVKHLPTWVQHAAACVLQYRVAATFVAHTDWRYRQLIARAEYHEQQTLERLFLLETGS